MPTEETRDVDELLSAMTDEQFASVVDTILKAPTDTALKKMLAELHRRWLAAMEMVGVQQNTIHGLYRESVIQVREDPDYSN